MILDGNIITREELSLIFFGDKDADSFYDIFENDSASPRFDCVNSVGECPGNGECYIIDRETGHYINWYKLYHFGRDLHTNMASKEEIVRFAKDFFNESEKEWNR